MQPSARQVRAYYDDFLRNTMLKYRVDGNRRLDLAVRFFIQHLRKDDVIVDVGCGIGVATEAMAKRAKKGRVLGLDLSEQNIWYANRTVILPNVSFHSIDVVNNADKILKLLPRRPNVITLCDVIEHIPEDHRVPLLRQLNHLGADNVRILLTFPSKYYQDFLRQEQPGELQIIDNSIPSECLAQEAANAGLSMTFFTMIDVWRKSQYAHCVLERDTTIGKRASEMAEQNTKTSLSFWNNLVRRYRRKKYIDKVFETQKTTREVRRVTSGDIKS
jgi:trans-aconitate methyltransferase